MNTLNKRRSGDENIGKLIVFAITIVIAIGLVGLVSYFYTQSREAAVNTGVLGSTSTTMADLQKVKGLETCTASGVTYDAISNKYALKGADASASPCNLTGFKGVTVVGSGYTLSN